MKNSCLAFTLAVVLISGCHHVSPPPPPTAGPIPAHSFVREASANLVLKNDSVESLYLRDELLIVYTHNNDAYSLDRDSLVLESLAEVAPAGAHIGAPVVFQNTIIYPANGTLQVYDHHGNFLGKIPRHPDPHLALRSPVIGSGSMLYTGIDYEHGGRVIAIDPSHPDVPRWEFLTDSGITAAPAYANGILYVGTEAGVVIAAQDQEGTTAPLGIFRFQTAGPIVADLKADNTGVYVASTDTKLYCLDPNTGKILWQYFAQHPLTESPTITATRVYQPVPDVGLVALDKSNGPEDRQALWIASSVAQILSEDDRCVYVRLDDNTIAAIDKQTGRRLFTSHRRDFVAYATNTKDATIYAATASGEIYAIRPVFTGGESGELVLKEERMKDEKSRLRLSIFPTHLPSRGVRSV